MLLKFKVIIASLAIELNLIKKFDTSITKSIVLPEKICYDLDEDN